jgi:uncharacterized protein DUF1501
MTQCESDQLTLSRRCFLGQAGMGLGAAALATLLPESACGASQSASSSGLRDLPHFAPRAKRAIYLFMNGAPSQLDLFDYKPKLQTQFDTDLPESVRMGQRLTTMTSGQSRFPVAPSKFKFQRYGESGAWVSELLPHTAKMVDDLAIVRSLHTEAINHDPATTYLCTGHQLPGRASIGSWISYGLGSMNRDLPAFVVMTPTWSSKANAQALFSRLWGSGFLPTTHQGVALRSQGDPVLFLSNPAGVNEATRRRMLDRVVRFNERSLETFGDPEIETRIEQFEMAFRMQTSVPDLMDISDEPEQILQMYGPDVRTPGTFAASCLLARRMVERDVRFVQIFHRGWDQHDNLPSDLALQCKDVDQGAWALIQDLKQRGLLEDTLVFWGGEFGRTVYCQGNLTSENYGRDHHPRCFTIWLAGGGVRPGIVYGETDDFSYNIVDKPIHIHDLNATIFHALGIDHRRLTYKFQGLDVRLTGVEEHEPVLDLIA